MEMSNVKKSVNIEQKIRIDTTERSFDVLRPTELKEKDKKRRGKKLEDEDNLTCKECSKERKRGKERERENETKNKVKVSQTS